MRTQDTLGAFIGQERARLQKARDKALQKKAKIDRELEGEINAITAYEQAKGGKPARAGKRAAAKWGRQANWWPESPQGRKAAGSPECRPAAS